MRKVLLCVPLLGALLAGCSKQPDPVVVTPELEAQQKQMEKSARDAESARQKSETGVTPTGKKSGADEEALRAKQQNKR